MKRVLLSLVVALTLFAAVPQAATQVIGAIAINNFLPSGARGAGSVPFGPVAIPSGYSMFTGVFDLTQVSSLTAVLSLTVQVSTDGVNFLDVGSVGLDLSRSGYVLNGSVLTRSGVDPLGPGPVRMFGAQVQLPHTESTTRQIQGTISSSEALTTGVTLMVF